jgi:peptidoglycan hydrolase-like protein with peptidoglycan-binding domain
MMLKLARNSKGLSVGGVLLLSMVFSVWYVVATAHTGGDTPEARAFWNSIAPYLRQRESSNDYTNRNGGNPPIHQGAYQFNPKTWYGLGKNLGDSVVILGKPASYWADVEPADAPPEVQDEFAYRNFLASCPNWEDCTYQWEPWVPALADARQGGPLAPKKVSPEQGLRPAAPSAPAVPCDQQVVRPGDRSNCVKVLQDRLIEKGYDVGGADGVFGPRTLLALKQYQYSNNIKNSGCDYSLPKVAGEQSCDGIAGGNTWKAVNGDASCCDPVPAQAPTPAPAPAGPSISDALRQQLQNEVCAFKPDSAGCPGAGATSPAGPSIPGNTTGLNQDSVRLLCSITRDCVPEKSTGTVRSLLCQLKLSNSCSDSNLTPNPNPRPSARPSQGRSIGDLLRPSTRDLLSGRRQPTNRPNSTSERIREYIRGEGDLNLSIIGSPQPPAPAPIAPVAPLPEGADTPPQPTCVGYCPNDPNGGQPDIIYEDGTQCSGNCPGTPDYIDPNPSAEPDPTPPSSSDPEPYDPCSRNPARCDSGLEPEDDDNAYDPCQENPAACQPPEEPNEGGYESSYEGDYESGYEGYYESSYESGYEGYYEGYYESSYENSYENGYENSYESSYESSYENGYQRPYDPCEDSSAYYGDPACGGIPNNSGYEMV